MLLRALIAVVATGTLAACADNPPPAPPGPVAKDTADYVAIDAEKLCHLYTTDCPRTTGQSFDACLAIYKAVRVTPACKDKLDQLTCDTATTNLDECWPACDGVPPKCDGPNIVECASTKRTFTYACEGVCATQGRTWSGDCGTSYRKQTSAVATCWCN